MVTTCRGNRADLKTTNGFAAAAKYSNNNNTDLLISPKGGFEFELVFAITESSTYWQQLTFVFCFATTDSEASKDEDCNQPAAAAG